MSFTRLLKLATRSALCGAMLGTAMLSAQTPNLAGNWQMDVSKSQVADGRSVSMAIATVANKIKLGATVRDKDGKETSVEFTCAADGKECELNEGGHKSKMSMWFSGDSLNVAKTDGPPGDVVNEWKLQMSAQGKVLTLTVSHVDPTAPDETLVFSKKAS